tara:strand:+ start:2497 stop:3390 length:894 start_codon:yes stop_codon:yes gene_type:complete
MVREVTIHEVGPRDGLQGLPYVLSVDQKRHFIEAIAHSGIKNIEVASFVHPKLVPTMANAEEVYNEVEYLQYEPYQNMNLSTLVMNQRGFDRALESGVENFNICFSTSEEFNKRNFGKEQTEILQEYAQMLQNIPKNQVKVYISCFFGCPFKGLMSDSTLLTAFQEAAKLGNTIVLCDTTGRAFPLHIKYNLALVATLPEYKQVSIALHLHEGEKGKEFLFDNIKAAFDFGIRNFDTSIGGIGGCPFMPHSGGNVPTEDLVEWCEKQNIDCGIERKNLDSLINLVKNEFREKECEIR